MEKSELKEKILSLKSKNKKIVFTNGCFDILHLGHLKYLEESKKLGDFLIVAINSDESVKILKGSGRPVNNYTLRSKNLKKLKFVDEVIIFSERTPINLIKYLLPDILTKGGDYKTIDIVGSSVVEKSGGKVVVLPFLKGYSTTNIINSKRKRLD
ncbi:MAG: D-glycero-beta-D-manno-heptose 1-phosphate adenylyltransferase [bacterium TMED250]|nr:MAG: D-glycero-beta-D-manno-heptose 1-phosphate adenylyltransferase [bacterium TMED250]